MEFEGPSFKEGETDAASAAAADNRDFSNPMYDMQSQPVGVAVESPAPASLTPPTIKHKELSPVSIDTGKDTQCLVEDDSEC